MSVSCDYQSVLKANIVCSDFKINFTTMLKEDINELAS